MLYVDAKVGEILVDSASDLQARKQMEKEKEERKKESETQDFSWPLAKQSYHRESSSQARDDVFL